METDKVENPNARPAVASMGGTARRPGSKNYSMDLSANKANDDLINFLE
jgi:hypothetical protein